MTLVIGFILGFFTAQIGRPTAPVASAPDPAAAGMPENHPTPETMEHLAHLQQDAESDPANREVRIALGNAYYDIGRFEAAASWYEQALALDPADANVNTDLGTAHLYQGEVETAIEIYRQSLAIEPGHPQTLQNMGIALFAQGRNDEAISYWQQLLSEHPDYPHADAILEQVANAREKAAQAQNP